MGEADRFTATLDPGGDAALALVTGRVLAVWAARADLGIDKVADAALIGDAIAVRFRSWEGAGRLHIHGRPGRLCIMIAPLEDSDARQLADSSFAANTQTLLARLADVFEVSELEDGRAAVRIELFDERHTAGDEGRPTGTSSAPALSPGAHGGVVLRLEAVAESVPVVRQALTAAGEALGLSEFVLEDVKLAVSEACANAIVHAYPDGDAGDHALTVEVATSDRSLLVEVHDAGVGMVATAASDGPGMGLGMGLMTSLSDSLTISDGPDGGTCVRLEFQLEPDGAAA